MKTGINFVNSILSAKKAVLAVLMLFSMHDPINAQQTDCSNQKVYTVVDEMPEFRGGEKALIDYLFRFSYLPNTKKEDLVSRIFVQFVVDCTGAVTQVSLKEGEPNKVRSAFITYIEAMPKWKPGQLNGIPVAVERYIPYRMCFR